MEDRLRKETLEWETIKTARNMFKLIIAIKISFFYKLKNMYFHYTDLFYSHIYAEPRVS